MRPTLTTAVVGVAAGVGALAAHAAAPVQLCGHYAALIPCASFVQHPGTLGFGSDGRVEAIHLRWSRWGSAVATAHGTLRSNGGPAGDPEWTSESTTLTASHIGTCRGHRVYLRLEVLERGSRYVLRGCVPH
jgi:hypothetical protein